MRKFGFKIFSTNLQTAPSLIEDDFKKIKQQIKDIEVRIHAPHHVMGFDAGNKELEKQNQKILAQSQKVADMFGAKTIVVHAGCGDGPQYLEETARQFKLFHDSRIVVENLPRSAINKSWTGATAEEIAYIMSQSGCGFCFDFSHAICAALRLNIDIETQLQSFYNLHPTVYHMCDGDTSKAEDMHLHFLSGNYPLSHYLNDFTAQDAYITMETGHGVMQHNDLWVKDYQYIRSLQK